MKIKWLFLLLALPFFSQCSFDANLDGPGDLPDNRFVFNGANYNFGQGTLIRNGTLSGGRKSYTLELPTPNGNSGVYLELTSTAPWLAGNTYTVEGPESILLEESYVKITSNYHKILSGTVRIDKTGTVFTITIEATTVTGRTLQGKYENELSQIDNTPTTDFVFNSGHYIYLEPGQSPSAVTGIDEPGVKGVMNRCSWKDVEPTKGNYDFSSIRADLQICKQKGKSLIVFFRDKSFNNDPMELPQYLSHLAINSGKGGITPKRWDPEYVERLSAVCAAMAEEFDNEPLFEGIAFQESALSLSGTILDENGYTDELYVQAIKDYVISANNSFKNSAVFWFSNFLGKYNRDTKTLMRDVLNEFVPYKKIVLAGPDILPYRTGLVNLSYQIYEEFNGQIALANSAQYDSYKHHANDTEVGDSQPPVDGDGNPIYMSMGEIFEFGRDNLYLNYIFWAYKNNANLPNTFINDVIPVIRTNPSFNPVTLN